MAHLALILLLLAFNTQTLRWFALCFFRANLGADSFFIVQQQSSAGNACAVFPSL